MLLRVPEMEMLKLETMYQITHMAMATSMVWVVVKSTPTADTASSWPPAF